MPTPLEDIERAALRLSPRERAQLVAHLLASLDAEEDDIESAWKTEVDQRMARLDAEQTASVPLATALARAQARLR